MEIQTGHIGLNVSDLGKSKRFYQDAFGLELIGESEQPERRSAFLGQKGAVVLTLWQQSEGRAKHDHPGLHHLSFRVETIGEVQAAAKKLRSMDVPFQYDGIVPHSEGGKSGGIFFED